MKSRTIITGGAGFIGSHLARRLADAGHSILLIDDLSTGRCENVQGLIDDAEVDCTLIEARASEALTDPVMLEGVDQIYHLAAAVGVKHVTDDPAGMIHNNVEQTLHVLEAAQRIDAPVLLASSSEVYGKCPVLPLREDMELVYGPTTASRWSYGMSKALDEHLALDLHRRGRLKPVIVRLFNVIGPRQVGRYGMVVPRFVERALANEPIDVYGDGQQTRTFCHVDDVVAALGRLPGEAACHGRVFNLGSDKQITIDQLADKVIEHSGSTGGKRYLAHEAVYGPNFEDPRHRLPDLSAIRRAIGFEPRIPLEQTLDQLIALERDKTGNNEASRGGEKSDAATEVTGHGSGRAS